MSTTPNYIEGLKQKEYELEEELRVVRKLIKDYETSSIFSENTKMADIKFYQIYDPTFTWEEKALFVINKFKSAYTSTIIEEIEANDPDVTKEKIESMISQAINRLKKKDIIKVVERTGRRLRYAMT